MSDVQHGKVVRFQKGTAIEEAREMSETGGGIAGPPTTLRAGLRRWFLRPPRPHGEVIEDRTVSFLELFFDLVYVVLIGQIAHTLAEDVSWSGVLDFVVVFGLIWIGWFNGARVPRAAWPRGRL